MLYNGIQTIWNHLMESSQYIRFESQSVDVAKT